MEDELYRVLSVVERIAMLQNPDETDEAWNDVYMLTHGYSQTCTGHPEWRKKLVSLEKMLEEQRA